MTECLHVVTSLHYSCQGQLGQGITSMIHQVEEGLGLTDSGAPASQDSSTGEGEKEGPGKDGDSTKPGGGETESSGKHPPSITARVESLSVHSV